MTFSHFPSCLSGLLCADTSLPRKQMPPSCCELQELSPFTPGPATHGALDGALWCVLM